MSNDELLHERIGRLERSLAGERAQREQAEATLAGLRAVAMADDLDATDEALAAGLRPLLGYEHAAVVHGVGHPPERLAAAATADAALAGLVWPDGPLRRRVLGGQTVALYDARQVPELAEPLRDGELRSLLCVPLSIPGRPAVLLATHSRPAFFSNHHVALARSFAQTAVRMLDNLAAREQAARRELAEQRAATLARANEALREQLDTIVAQRRQIQRLRAPVLVVAERTVLVPLIGSLDHEGLAEVTRALLDAVSQERARTIILDLTGFEAADAQTAARIESLARTTAMLGARCELSGVQPATAIVLSDTSVRLQVYRSLADALAARLM